MIICKNCSNAYDEKYEICPKCGTPCNLPIGEMSTAMKKSNSKLITIISISVVAVIGLIIALLIIFSQPSSQSLVSEQISLGEKYLTEENYEEAIVAFKKAIEIEPNDPDLYIKLADAYIANGDIESAISTLQDGYEKTYSANIKIKLDKLTQVESEASEVSAEESSEVSAEQITTVELAAVLSEVQMYDNKVYVSFYHKPNEIYTSNTVYSLPDSIKDEAGIFAFYDNYIYYSDCIQHGTGQMEYNTNLYRCNLDGTNKEKLLNDCHSYSLILYNNKIFYTNTDGNAKCFDIISKTYDDIAYKFSYAYKNKGYYIENDSLYSYNFDDSTVEKVTDSVYRWHSGGGNYLYLYDSFDDDSILRINLDDNQEEFIPDIYDFYALDCPIRGYILEEEEAPSIRHIYYLKNINTGEKIALGEFRSAQSH